MCNYTTGMHWTKTHATVQWPHNQDSKTTSILTAVLTGTLLSFSEPKPVLPSAFRNLPTASGRWFMNVGERVICTIFEKHYSISQKNTNVPN